MNRFSIEYIYDRVNGPMQIGWFGVPAHHLGTVRDTQRLPTTPFSLVLRKEYFDRPQRDFHAVHYI